MYTEKVMDHFTNPRNVGEIENEDGKGIAGDPDCGDYLVITIKVENDFISDIKFKVHGCAGAISTSSAITEMAKGKHVLEAFAITNNDVILELDGLPEEKVHCSLLGTVALKNAIVDFAKRNDRLKGQQNE